MLNALYMGAVSEHSGTERPRTGRLCRRDEALSFLKLDDGFFLHYESHHRQEERGSGGINLR